MALMRKLVKTLIRYRMAHRVLLLLRNAQNKFPSIRHDNMTLSLCYVHFRGLIYLELFSFTSIRLAASR